MPRHPFNQPRGRFETIHVESATLAENMLGDPFRRSVVVYLPEGYDANNEAFPLMVDLVGFTGSGFAHVGWKAFQESLPQQIDRLVDSGLMGHAIFAFPDCFTSLGGNQYINSAAMGNWEDFLCGDMLQELLNVPRKPPVGMRPSVPVLAQPAQARCQLPSVIPLRSEQRQSPARPQTTSP